MKTIYFSLLIAFFIALIKADGTAYEATWYGGPNDHHREMYPSCSSDKYPNTDYYAAVSREYDKDLCDTYAVAMAVDNKDSSFLGKMVKVRIVDSCGECERSHIDLSEDAFNSVRKKGDGIFPVIWVAADKNGNVHRDIVYPSSKTEKFAKEYFQLSKTDFVNNFKSQALKMIREGITHADFDKYVPRTTTKKTTTVPKTTTTVRKTTTTVAEAKVTEAPEVKKEETPVEDTPVEEVPVDDAPVETAAIDDIDVDVPAVAGLGDITIETEESNDKSVPVEAPIVGHTKVIDPNKTDYTDEEIKVLESQFPDEEEGSSYAAGILSGVFAVSGAAGVGLLYLKKQSPGKYDEIKQKFPEAFDNIKRSVSRSATHLKRGVTKSFRGKKQQNRNTEHPELNYREMPEYMFGNDGLPRIELHDLPAESLNESFPDLVEANETSEEESKFDTLDSFPETKVEIQ